MARKAIPNAKNIIIVNFTFGFSEISQLWWKRVGHGHASLMARRKTNTIGGA